MCQANDLGFHFDKLTWQTFRPLMLDGAAAAAAGPRGVGKIVEQTP